MTASELSDLIGRVSLGDRQAFRMLYDRTNAKLFGVCLHVLVDRGDAEDAYKKSS